MTFNLRSLLKLRLNDFMNVYIDIDTDIDTSVNPYLYLNITHIGS